MSVVAGLLTAKYFSGTSVPTQADYAVIIGLIVGAIVFQIVMYFAVLTVRGRISDVETNLSYKLGLVNRIGDLNSELAKELIHAVDKLSQQQRGVEAYGRRTFAGS